jgi:hypothetical protein
MPLFALSDSKPPDLPDNENKILVTLRITD